MGSPQVLLNADFVSCICNRTVACDRQLHLKRFIAGRSVQHAQLQNLQVLETDLPCMGYWTPGRT